MKIAVVAGSGLIGSTVVTILDRDGQQAVRRHAALEPTRRFKAHDDVV